jgi:hypothetical protein
MTRQPLSIREIIIPVLVAILVGLGTWVLTKEKQDTAQDVNIENVCQRAEQIDSNVKMIYEELVLMKSGQAVLEANQKQILERLNR